MDGGKGVGKVGVGKAKFGKAAEPTEEKLDVCLRVVNPEAGLFELDQSLKRIDGCERRICALGRILDEQERFRGNRGN